MIDPVRQEVLALAHTVVVKVGTNVLTGATATTKISRKEFGVLWNNLIESMPVVGDEVTITIDLELNRPALPGSTQP